MPDGDNLNDNDYASIYGTEALAARQQLAWRQREHALDATLARLAVALAQQAILLQQARQIWAQATGEE